MEFLKEILGDELFEQVQTKINEHNGNEANKDNQIKIGNLGSGQYVSKDKFNSKESELSAKVQELLEANNLIGELKKGNKNNEDLQNKIADYDTQIATLQEQVQEAKIKSALKIALMGEKALDVDYLTFKLNEKLNEKGEHLELDENENIKGLKDNLDFLKNQFPTQFESPKGKIYDENHLPDGEKNEINDTSSMADALKQYYEKPNN